MVKQIGMIVVVLGIVAPAWGDSSGRFFVEGDGILSLHDLKSGERAVVTYRTADGIYPSAARKTVDRLFGFGSSDGIQGISLRLIALLDYIQDHWGGGKEAIQLVSAYRSPSYNQWLRERGGTVAKASLHLEGMAADIKIAGVPGQKLWEALRSKNCCGVGWYGGGSVHVDSGSVRFWTGATAKTDTDISDHNKRILLRSDQDIYVAGEKMKWAFAAMTEFPFGVVQQWRLVAADAPDQNKGRLKFVPRFAHLHRKPMPACIPIHNAAEARGIAWQIPRLKSPFAGRQVVRVDFCKKPHPDMPDFILSNQIEIR